jgi:hypothetical protein
VSQSPLRMRYAFLLPFEQKTLSARLVPLFLKMQKLAALWDLHMRVRATLFCSQIVKQKCALQTKVMLALQLS